MNEKPHAANHLAGSLSPYLLQHLHNPVDWHPWKEETLEKARRENKLIVVSIGYAACHWCHVMEHESFADEEVAALMNQHFVSIKVDREERPDIDQVYMDAVMLMSRRGGWPLNVIALPDGRPIYGGTYFPKRQWMEVLRQLAAVWREEPGRARDYARELTESLNAMDAQPATNAGVLNRGELEALLKSWMGRMDRKEGGENREPKFPMPANWRMLMRAAHLLSNAEVKAQVKLTLDKMALGGIYDQIGGGFARYSTDALWHVPHFEKMLYDNAQLLSLYAEAFTCFREPLYAETVSGIAAFCMRELRDAQGGWCSSLDADSEGVEGKFYVWTMEEVKSVLGEESEWFSEYFHLTEEGNWEHGLNVPIASATPAEFDTIKNWSAGTTSNKLKAANARLLAERAHRIRPGLDDKVIASWNGLMVRGLCDAWLALGEAEWLKAAKETFDFISRALLKEGNLLRCYRQGHSHISGFLDDFALVADAALALFQCTGERRYYDAARQLCDTALDRFDHPGDPLLWYTSKEDAPLIARKKETNDNVIPAANSVMAHLLFTLGTLSGDEKYLDRSQRMAAALKSGLQQYPGAYAHWGSLCLQWIFPPAEVVISAPDPLPLLLQWHETYLPGTVLLPLTGALDLALAVNRFAGDQVRIYVCQNQACHLPVQTVEEAWAQCASL